VLPLHAALLVPERFAVADKQNFRQGNPILFVVLVTGGAPERLLSSDFTGHGRCILDSPEMPIPPLEVFVFAPLIVLTAYVIFGISGFGSTLIAVPLLAHLFPLKFVIPMMVILDCIGSISMGFRLRADVNRHELVPLLPFMLTGMIAGVFVLLSVPGGVLLGVLGVLVLAYGLLYISRKDAIVRFARWSAVPIGLFAGTTSTTFGVGGPIYVMYLTGRGSTPEQIRATMPVIFILTTIARIVIFAAAGLYTQNVLIIAAGLLPIMVIGMWIGNRLHVNLPRARLVHVIGALLIASGISLLLRAAAI
jgi:uncharacterized membrane protein YfcA